MTHAGSMTRDYWSSGKLFLTDFLLVVVGGGQLEGRPSQEIIGLSHVLGLPKRKECLYWPLGFKQCVLRVP